MLSFTSEIYRIHLQELSVTDIGRFLSQTGIVLNRLCLFFVWKNIDLLSDQIKPRKNMCRFVLYFVIYWHILYNLALKEDRLTLFVFLLIYYNDREEPRKEQHGNNIYDAN